MTPFFFNPPQTFDEQPALVQKVNREDVMWNRPVFRAPPLKITPPDMEAEIFNIIATPAVAR